MGPGQSGGYDSEIPLQGVQVRPPAGELRSHMLHGVANK